MSNNEYQPTPPSGQQPYDPNQYQQYPQQPNGGGYAQPYAQQPAPNQQYPQQNPYAGPQEFQPGTAPTQAIPVQSMPPTETMPTQTLPTQSWPQPNQPTGNDGYHFDNQNNAYGAPDQSTILDQQMPFNGPQGQNAPNGPAYGQPAFGGEPNPPYGPQGPQGYGPQGPQGPQGYGPQGPQGPQGYGPQGPQGPQYGGAPFAQQPQKSNTGKIVAIVVAIVAVIAIIAGVTWYLVANNKGKDEAKSSTTQSQTTNKNNGGNSGNSNNGGSDSDSNSDNSNSSNNSSGKMYSSMEEYVKSPEVKQELESQMGETGTSGMKMSVEADGDTLVMNMTVPDSYASDSMDDVYNSSSIKRMYGTLAKTLDRLVATKSGAKIRLHMVTESGKTVTDTTYTPADADTSDSSSDDSSNPFSSDPWGSSSDSSDSSDSSND